MTALLQRLDQWLIDTPYQGLINWSQRQPAWWVEQCAAAIAVCAITEAALKPELGAWEYFGLLLSLVLATGFFFYSRLPAVLVHAAKNDRFRRLILALTILGWAAMAISPKLKAGLSALSLASDVLPLSVWYFAACKPPKPREPRKKLNLNAAPRPLP